MRHARRVDEKSNPLAGEKSFNAELTAPDIEDLARKFASLIPEGRFTPAQIQGEYILLPNAYIADS